MPFSTALLFQPEPSVQSQTDGARVPCSQARPPQGRASGFSSSFQERRGRCQTGGVCETRWRPDSVASAGLRVRCSEEGSSATSTGGPDNKRRVNLCAHSPARARHQENTGQNVPENRCSSWERNLVQPTVHDETPRTPANSLPAPARDRKGQRVPQQQEAGSAFQGSSTWARGAYRHRSPTEAIVTLFTDTVSKAAP